MGTHVFAVVRHNPGSGLKHMKTQTEKVVIAEQCEEERQDWDAFGHVAIEPLHSGKQSCLSYQLRRIRHMITPQPSGPGQTA